MPLTAGAHLGPYEILAALGAGGMGEVYRARDTKLDRDVAIKVLPELFVSDPERVARFQREATTLAALNHPHIGGIYGLEEADGVRALVLELVDGPTLADRIAQGPIPLDEALPIARQIAEALEAAHEQGIIHRDLKPANIKLRPDGTVKVLDFGLAKALEPMSAASPMVTASPTITTPAMMTGIGMILGTAAYMSPEQARGRATDKRSDVWAFGCVLYEMLTGRRVFDGEETTAMIAAVVKIEPDWNAFPSDVPTHIRKIVQRCLAKDRKARIPDLSVARFMFDETTAAAATDAASTRPRPTRVLRLWQAATALLLLTTIAGPVTSLLRARSPAVTRFIVSPPEGTTFFAAGRRATGAAISPDGLKLAFTARDASGKALLWVRSLDSVTAQPLIGTDDASFPFWSPDSRFIGYSAPGKLMKIAASGGPPQTLCAFSTTTIVGRGGAWNRDGVIVFNNGPGQPLFRVSSAGGQPSPVGNLANGQNALGFPSFLPDGDHVLYHATASTPTVSGLHVMSLDTGESKRLLEADTSGIYASQGGYLLFVRQGTLLAQTFDPKTLAFLNEPFPIAEHVESGAVAGLVTFSVSENGMLSYGIGSGEAADVQMVWLDRQGKQSETVGPPGNYRGIDLSPDGTRVAAHRHDGNGGDIWITELSRGTTSRFTFDAQDSSSPVWAPDARRIDHGSFRNGKGGLYQKLSNGTGPEEKLLESDVATLPVSWSPDGQSIVYSVLDPKASTDQWMLPLSGDRKPVPLLHMSFQESHGQVSPNGKWLAYYSNETGRTEVYVQSFPQGTGKWQVSTNGGVFPRWRRDGRELFYMSQALHGKMMAVDVKSSGSAFEATAPKELFDPVYLNLSHAGPYHTYAVSPDGQRFLIPRSPSTDQQTTAPIVVVLNWMEELKQREPVK